jgi:hypothetical protein
MRTAAVKGQKSRKRKFEEARAVGGLGVGGGNDDGFVGVGVDDQTRFVAESGSTADIRESGDDLIGYDAKNSLQV